MHMTKKKNIEVIELLQHNANRNIINSFGKTAIMCAIERGNAEIIDLLI